jgi:hypothetical protein
MDWDYYTKHDENEQIKTTTEQRYTTRQRAIKDYTINTRNSRQRAASTSHDKAQKSNSKGARMGLPRRDHRRLR